ncbi:MAG: FHA domain-containing protein [Eubacterium sp.]|nr:FHA domain-containing protein [Eubacterium sp.]
MKRETILNIRYGMQTYSYTLEEYISEEKKVVTIGRSMDCDIMIRNAGVAEKHAAFCLEKEGWVYRDFGSAAGSSMNGQRIKWVKVFDGSTIALNAFPNLDTLYIDISMKVDGMPVVPGQPKVDVFNDRQPQGAGMGYSGSDSAGRRDTSFTGLNAFGLGAAFVWSIIAVVFLINFFRTISALDGVNIFCNFSAGITIVALFIMYLVTAGGMVLFPISLFSYRKRNTFLGMEMIAAGYTGTIIAYMLILMIGLGSLFWELFGSTYFLMTILVIGFNLAALISLTGLFKMSADMEKVGTNWYRPIIYFSLSWVMVFILAGMAASDYNNAYGASLTLADSLPMDNIWMDIAWFAAIILSCVYIHVDETPHLAQKYEVKSRQ